jgi:hypothetical protein
VLWLTNIIGFTLSLSYAVGAWWLGRRHRSGWLIYALCETSWIGYAVLLRQWAIIPWCVLHGSLYVRNWKMWGNSAVRG